MGYSVKNLKTALQKTLDFVEVIESNGYNSVDGNCSALRFEKGWYRIRVFNQICGYVTSAFCIDDDYKSEKYITCHLEELDKKIKEFEKETILN